jgi:hypothetical protein
MRASTLLLMTGLLLGSTDVVGADKARQPPRAPPREVLGEDPVRAAFGYPPASSTGTCASRMTPARRWS